MSVADALLIMIAFATFVVALINLIIIIVKAILDGNKKIAVLHTFDRV